MKSIALVVTLVFLVLCQGRAQEKHTLTLAGTSWKGTAYVPDPLVCLVKFGKDSARLLYVDDPQINIADDVTGTRAVSGKDSAVLETMIYHLSGDTISLQKVAGGSPCGGEIGQYHVQISNGKIKLIMIQDPCAVRPYAFREEYAIVK